LVTGVGTSEWLGTGASERCNVDARTSTPNLPRLLLNEAAALDRQRLPKRGHIKPPGAGLRDERADQSAAFEDCADSTPPAREPAMKR